jgi:hypothetical protein
MAIALLWHVPDNARVRPASYGTRALILAVVAVAPPVGGVIELSASWLVRAAESIPVSAEKAGEIIESWAIGGCLAAPLGATLAVWALLCAYRAAVEDPERSAAARSHRRLAVRLALVALVLNGAAPWLHREGRLLTTIRQSRIRSDKPAVAPPYSRSPGGSGVSPTGPPATPTTHPDP